VSGGSDPEKPALIAIDLGAESCRVSLLSWREHAPSISMVRRFENGPEDHGQDGLRWNLDRICIELEAGLRSCADMAPEGIASIGVTGWAVDYVRLDASGRPLAQPFCYRDERAQAAFKAVHAIVPPATLYGRTGVQIQPINTIYQLYADKSSGVAGSAPWVNLPEYILHWLGAPRIAESTNATHTGLIDADTREWSGTLFEALGLEIAAAPELVPPGSGSAARRSSPFAGIRDNGACRARLSRYRLRHRWNSGAPRRLGLHQFRNLVSSRYTTGSWPAHSRIVRPWIH
jgi:rhamnulokinase